MTEKSVIREKVAWKEKWLIAVAQSRVLSQLNHQLRLLLTFPVVWTTPFPKYRKKSPNHFFELSFFVWYRTEICEKRKRKLLMTRFGVIRVNCTFSVAKYLPSNIDRWVSCTKKVPTVIKMYTGMLYLFFGMKVHDIVWNQLGQCKRKLGQKGYGGLDNLLCPCEIFLLVSVAG